MRQESLDFLENLINCSGPSGYEEETAELWREYVSQYAQDVTVGKYGSSIARVGEEFGQPKIMLCSHIDEIGMMVNFINDDGFIYISAVGGVDHANIIGQQVTIYGKELITGVIARKAAHLLADDEETNIPKLHELYVDIGAKTKEEAEEVISIGDPVTVDRSFYQLLNDRIVGRGIDDRMGTWIVAEVMRELSNLNDFKASVYGVASIQEEIGGAGAAMQAYNINPDVAIAIDVIHATDTPDSDKEKNGDVELDKGPVISIGSVAHKKITSTLRSVAEAHSVDIQLIACPEWSGTDAESIYIVKGGIPTAVVSVPNRYMHSPVEMVTLKDLESTKKLLVEWCRSLTVEDF